MDCRSEGNPPPNKFTWKKNGVIISSSTFNRRESKKYKNANLLDDLQNDISGEAGYEEDKGFLYKNSKGYSMYRPFLYKTSDVGTDSTFIKTHSMSQKMAQSFVRRDFLTSKMYSKKSTLDNFKIFQNGSLLIRRVRLADQGAYSCEAKSDLTTSVSSPTTHVIVAGMFVVLMF